MIRKYKKYQAYLPLAAVVCGLCLLVVGGFLWQRTMRLQRQTEDLNERIATINRNGIETVEPQQLQDLADLARQRGHVVPEVEYALLHRQWRQAVILFDRLRATLANPYLADRARSSASALHKHLLELRDAAADNLAGDRPLPLAWQWKIYTLKGNTAVLLAYSVLYHEKDGRKAAKLLSDALNDYKTAIQLVDQVSLSSMERALPRWNLELIVAVGEYRRIGLSEIPPADMARVQEQLQTYIPEAPGFSPGAPLETRVEK